MLDLIINIISICGGFVFVFSLIFQFYKILKTKSSDDLSIGWLILMSLSIASGITYGIYFNLWPIWIANSCQLLISLSIMAVKIYQDNSKKIEKNKT